MYTYYIGDSVIISTFNKFGLISEYLATKGASFEILHIYNFYLYHDSASPNMNMMQNLMRWPSYQRISKYVQVLRFCFVPRPS